MFSKIGLIKTAPKTKEGLKIVYDDVAPYAKEHSNPKIVRAGLCPRIGLHPTQGLYPWTTTIEKEFPDLKRDDLTYPGYALCYPEFALLNGQYINFPTEPQDYGFISAEWSNADSNFAYSQTSSGLAPAIGLRPHVFLFPAEKNELSSRNPMLTITFNQKFTSVGILLTFNLTSGDYATLLTMQWYAGDELLSNKEFAPDNVRYFCNNYVSQYDKIVITFKQTSRPFRPVFLTRIDYGLYRDFLSDELLETRCLQEINAISENISVNTLSFTVRTRSNIPFDLQKKQKLSLFFDGGLLGNFYLKNGARKNKSDYYLDSHDAVGVLDGNEFFGGIYTGQKMADVVAEIFSGEDFDCHVDAAYQDTSLNGYIPPGTKRAALVQIAFAVGAIVDTSNIDCVSIYPQETVSTGVFNGDNTFDGLTLEHSDIVTGVRLAVHSYQPMDEVEELYHDTLTGTAEIVFAEPHHSLSITGGEIKKSGSNYAVVVGTGTAIILSGKKYKHSTSQMSKENKDIVFNKNTKEVQDATLINAGNAQQALDRIYNYYQHSEKVVGDALLEDKVIGQIVTVDTGYDGTRTGIIESIDYGFGNKIKAKVTIHEYT